MKVELNLLNRIVLPSILKNEGKFEEMIVVKDIKKKISITQEEVKNFEIFTTKEGNMGWNEEGSKKIFEYEFTELEEKAIKEGLNKLNNESKLTEDHIELYKLFIN